MHCRWVELLEDLGGLPPSMLRQLGHEPLSATIGRSVGRVDSGSLMVLLRGKLARWEAAARRAIENGEQ
eukprot:scaffold16549_cov43-Prasinocladus_malaysianus.AAC.1